MLLRDSTPIPSVPLQPLARKLNFGGRKEKRLWI